MLSTRFILVPIMIWSSTTAAAANRCPPMPTAVTNVSRDIISDINIGVGSLGRIRLGELSVRTEIVANNVLQRHKNMDRMLILQTMAATYCPMLRESTSLSDADKLARWEKFQDKVLQLQADQRSATVQAPSDSQPRQGASGSGASPNNPTPSKTPSQIAREIVDKAERDYNKTPPPTQEQIQMAGAILAIHMMWNRGLVGSDPYDPPEAEDAFARASLAMNQVGGKKSPETAIPHYLHALRLRETVLGPQHKLVGKTLGHLALAHFELGQNEEGMKYAARAKEILGIK